MYTFKTECGQIITTTNLRPMDVAARALRLAKQKGFDTLICWCSDGMIYGDYSSHLQRELGKIKTSPLIKIS